MPIFISTLAAHAYLSGCNRNKNSQASVFRSPLHASQICSELFVPLHTGPSQYWLTSAV